MRWKRRDVQKRPHGRHRHRLEDNVKMNCKEMEPYEMD
jgi:hypothetical protein